MQTYLPRPSSHGSTILVPTPERITIILKLKVKRTIQKTPNCTRIIKTEGNTRLDLKLTSLLNTLPASNWMVLYSRTLLSTTTTLIPRMWITRCLPVLKYIRPAMLWTLLANSMSVLDAIHLSLLARISLSILLNLWCPKAPLRLLLSSHPPLTSLLQDLTVNSTLWGKENGWPP
jgi:hypothetical protein